METGIPARLSAAAGRKFGLTVGGAFGVLAALAWWRGHPLTLGIFATLGGGLVLAALVVPTGLGPVYRAWMGLGLQLSRVTTPIFVSAIFFLVVTPTGLLMRLFGRRPLARPPGSGTLWVTRPADARQRRDMEHQF